MKYAGSCHCQKVMFVCEFKLQQPTVCDCSYCSKRHAVLHIVDDIKINTGKKELSCYRFNQMKGAHYFCKHCGIFVYSMPPEPIYPYAISLCTLDACEWEHLPVHYFDGKTL